MQTLARLAFARPPEIVCDRATWFDGVAELRRRAGGRRESGAFLLGTMDKRRIIREFVFYDDIDPNSLKTGMVQIDGRKLGTLWNYCRKKSCRVVADIHVHPGHFQQSSSDQANPVIAEVGHIAFILPQFATRGITPGAMGVYQYLGARQWRDRSYEQLSPFHVGWWPSWS